MGVQRILKWVVEVQKAGEMLFVTEKEWDEWRDYISGKPLDANFDSWPGWVD